MSKNLEPDTREHFVADDGVEIAYAVYGSAESPGLPVILQHGFAADSIINWVAPGIVAAIVARGRTVVTVDARGHGHQESHTILHSMDTVALHAMSGGSLTDLGSRRLTWEAIPWART